MPFVQLQRYLDWLHCTKLILIIVINCYLPVDHHYQTVVLKHMISSHYNLHFCSMNWVLINMGVIWISGKINVKSAPGAMITMQSADTLSPFQMIAVKARSAERWQGSRGFQRLPLCHTRSTSSERSLHKRCQTHFLEIVVLSFLTFGTREPSEYITFAWDPILWVVFVIKGNLAIRMKGFVLSLL